MRLTSMTRTAAMAAVILPAALILGAPAPATAVELTQGCTNPDDRYSVDLPRGWYYNEAVDGGESDDVSACRFFSPEDFEVRPASGVAGVAISIGREATAPRAEGRSTTVDGGRAIIVETVTAEDGFEPAGTRHYQYWIDIGADWLVAGTSDGPTWVGDYRENQATLDAMMETLSFRTATLPDTAVPDGAPVPLTLVGGLAMIVLALGARALRVARRED